MNPSSVFPSTREKAGFFHRPVLHCTFLLNFGGSPCCTLVKHSLRERSDTYLCIQRLLNCAQRKGTVLNLLVLIVASQSSAIGLTLFLVIGKANFCFPFETFAT